MSVIKKTINQVKDDVGIYYHFQGYRGFFEESDSKKNIMGLLDRMSFRSFNTNVDMFCQLFNGDLMAKGYLVEVNEVFYKKHADYVDLEGGEYFKEYEDFNLYVMENIRYHFERFLENHKNNPLVRVLKKEGVFKDTLLKTEFGKKLNYLFNNDDMFGLNDKEKQLTDFLNVNTVKEYSTSEENQLVSLPADYEDIIKEDGVGAYIIKDNKIIKEHGYLYRIGYDKVKNAMVFKVELQKAGHYRLELQEDGSYDFDKAHGLSSVKGVYLNEEDAKAAFMKIIEVKRKELEEMEIEVSY